MSKRLVPASGIDNRSVDRETKRGNKACCQWGFKAKAQVRGFRVKVGAVLKDLRGSEKWCLEGTPGATRKAGWREQKPLRWLKEGVGRDSPFEILLWPLSVSQIV